jgi:hypothetical protein
MQYMVGDHHSLTFNSTGLLFCRKKSTHRPKTSPPAWATILAVLGSPGTAVVYMRSPGFPWVLLPSRDAEPFSFALFSLAASSVKSTRKKVWFFGSSMTSGTCSVAPGIQYCNEVMWFDPSCACIFQHCDNMLWWPAPCHSLHC